MENKYNKTIGYSPLKDVNREKMRQVIHINKKVIEKYFLSNSFDRILVAGAGQGDEAELVYEEYQLTTLGVDINIVKLHSSEKHAGLSFHKQNLEYLAFADNSFSMIYCYHVLEHVSNHLAVLRELHRVLSQGGVLFIGFPNKHRLFSYVGTSQKVSIIEKIKWNVNDYVYRIKGKFENINGAHAGFSENEFLLLSRDIFQNVQPVRNTYMLIKYPKLEWFIKMSMRTGGNEILFPSNYYICIK